MFGVGNGISRWVGSRSIKNCINFWIWNINDWGNLKWKIFYVNDILNSNIKKRK